MKLAMAQMAMTADMHDNYQKSLSLCDAARSCDVLFFPEIQLSPFFPQYEKTDASRYALSITDPLIRGLAAKAAETKLYLSPNIYLEQNGRRYDASLFIRPDGTIQGVSTMVHILQAEQFYEADYYTPSADGFRVYPTPFGTIGIVICFDRHLPESVRTCALLGADLILIPTANTKAEPLDLFEWEIRVQAMQNQVFIAMCNRVGQEGAMAFAGQSLLAGPDGALLAKADDQERLMTADIDLSKAAYWRKKRPYLSLRRPELYR